jgi:hypothetical protein
MNFRVKFGKTTNRLILYHFRAIQTHQATLFHLLMDYLNFKRKKIGPYAYRRGLTDQNLSSTIFNRPIRPARPAHSCRLH